MRRLFAVFLIHAYENLKIANSIRDSDGQLLPVAETANPKQQATYKLNTQALPTIQYLVLISCGLAYK